MSLNRVFLIFFTFSFFHVARSKEYQRCDLLTELTEKYRVPLHDAVKLTCRASLREFRTNNENNGTFGIFGINCDKCDNSNCSLYLDDDITDDLQCLNNKNDVGNVTTHVDCEKEIIQNCYTSTTSQVIAPNCTTNICDVMTSASHQSLQTMLAAIVANLDSILYDPCEAVFALHHLRGISPREIGMWACVITDFVKCRTHLTENSDGEGHCNIDCAKIESQYGFYTKNPTLCMEIIEAINDSYELFNETLSSKTLFHKNCLEWIPAAIDSRCQLSQETIINDEKSLFNNMLELLDKEARGSSITDLNQLEVISNSSYDPSTLDPCTNLVVNFNENITSELSVAWLCFARENVNCFRREQKMCFTPNCASLEIVELQNDPNCDFHIRKVADYVEINKEVILNTPERPLDDCRVEANIFLQDCLYHLSQKRLMEAQDMTTDETRYGVPISLVSMTTSVPFVEPKIEEIQIDNNVIMSMGLSLQVNESNLMVQETFEKFLGDPCHVKTVLDHHPSAENDLASMFCFAYDVLWCSSNEAPLKCNVDCKTVRDNIIQDDSKCIERLNQIIMVGEKMQKILGLSSNEYSSSCMNSFSGFIASCRLIKGSNINREEPLYTRWAVRPTIQTRIQSNFDENRASEASVSIFSGNNDPENEELMTIRITTASPSSSTTTSNPVTEVDETEDFAPVTQKMIFEQIENMTLDDTFTSINACDLYRNSSASETEFANTFCAIYENAWCKLINSEGDCSVPCASLNFDDDTQLCEETLNIMYSISSMWEKIFMEERLTYIPKCEIWSRQNLAKCGNPEFPVLSDTLDDKIEGNETLTTQKANALAKEKLCGIMRTFHDIYLIEEDQRSGWYCFAFDIFSCTIGRNSTVNCPVNCNNALDSFIKVDENCEKRYRYVEDIATTIDSRYMIENHNIKPTDCRKDLRKILKVCDITLEDYSTTTMTSSQVLESSTVSLVGPDMREIADQEPIESLKSLSHVTESPEIKEKMSDIEEKGTNIEEIEPILLEKDSKSPGNEEKFSKNSEYEDKITIIDENDPKIEEKVTKSEEINTNIAEKDIKSPENEKEITKIDEIGSKIEEKDSKRLEIEENLAKIEKTYTKIDENQEILTKSPIPSTTRKPPPPRKSFDYQVFFPQMSCSKLHHLYEGISKDPEVIVTYTCFYIDYIFCSVNDPECAIDCDSIEYDLTDRPACKSILKSINAKMHQFSSIVKNLTHIADDCKPFYRNFLSNCTTEEEKVEVKTEKSETETTFIWTTERTTTTVKVETTPKTTTTTSTTTTTTKKPTTSKVEVVEDDGEVSSSEILNLRDTISRINPPSYDFTDSQQVEDDPVVCEKLYSLKAYLNIQPETVISYYCFLQDYVLCKEQDPNCDLGCRNVHDEVVRDSQACQKLVLSISRNRKHAQKYHDDGFTGSVEECKTRNSLACTELADKYFITSTTVRPVTSTEETEKVYIGKSEKLTSTEDVKTTTTEKIVPETTEKVTIKPVVHFTSRHEVTESTSTTEEATTTSTTTIPSTTTTTTEVPEPLLESTTIVDYPENDEEYHDSPIIESSNSVIMTDHLNFCHLKEIFVKELGNSDPSELVSYFCFMQDYISCLNHDENCKIDCDTTEDETIRSTELCRNAVTFVNEMREKVPMIVTHRVDMKVCKKSLENMFDGCESMTSTTSEVPITTTNEALMEVKEDILTTTEQISSENEQVTPKIENSPQGGLIVKQNSLETSNLADFFTIGIMHPKSMAKANFQIGLKEAQIKNIVITPDTDNSNFNVAFTFHVDEDGKTILKSVEN